MEVASGPAQILPERLCDRLSETAARRRTWILAALASPLVGIAICAAMTRSDEPTVANGIAWMAGVSLVIASFAVAVILLGRANAQLASVVTRDWAEEKGFDYSPAAGAEEFERLRSACLSVRFVKASFTHRIAGTLCDRRFEMGQFATVSGENSEGGRYFRFERRASGAGRIVVRPSYGWMDFGSTMTEVKCAEDKRFTKWLKLFSDRPAEAKSWADAGRREFLFRLAETGKMRFLADVEPDRAFILLYFHNLVRPGSRFVPASAAKRAIRIRTHLDKTLILAREMMEELDR